MKEMGNMSKTRTSKMQVQHRRTYVRFGPTEGFEDWKDLKRLDHIEGEDGQACAL